MLYIDQIGTQNNVESSNIRTDDQYLKRMYKLKAACHDLCYRT